MLLQLDPKKPFFCNYWTTYRCNSKCGFCKIWRDPELQRISDAKFEDVEKNLNDLKKIGVKMIDFTGGEPLLNKDLPQILRHAKKLGFFIKLSTNGYFYPEKAEEIKDLANIIFFSLEAVSKEEYRQIRGLDGFDRLIESIDIAKKLGQKISFLYTVTDSNIQNIDDIINFCKEKKVGLCIHPCFNYFGNKELSKKNIKIVEKYFWHPYVRISLPQFNFHYKGGNDINNPSCKVGRSTLEISPDNCLTVPCFHRYTKKIKLNGNLYKIYKSPEWNKLFEKAGTYDFCKHCTIDCHFGLAYFDRLKKYFFRQHLSYFKDYIEKYLRK